MPKGSQVSDRGWRIALEHPLHADRWLAQVFVLNRGLATSTVMKRRWRKAGQLAHHLIDPRTGRPAQTDALSVTVLAPRTVLAEIYAKAALILGAEAGLAYLEQLPEVEGLIFTAAGRIVCTEPALHPCSTRWNRLARHFLHNKDWKNGHHEHNTYPAQTAPIHHRRQDCCHHRRRDRLVGRLEPCRPSGCSPGGEQG